MCRVHAATLAGTTLEILLQCDPETMPDGVQGFIGGSELLSRLSVHILFDGLCSEDRVVLCSEDRVVSDRNQSFRQFQAET